MAEESEVVSLNRWRYRQNGLCEILQISRNEIVKKSRYRKRVMLSRELSGNKTNLRRRTQFLIHHGTRLQTLDVYRICQRLKISASLSAESKKFEFTSHKFRQFFKKGDG